MKHEKPRATPRVDKFDRETLIEDISKYPRREWCKAVALARQLENELNAALDGLRSIQAIKNSYTGSDWDEIEEARRIAQETIDNLS